MPCRGSHPLKNRKFRTEMQLRAKERSGEKRKKQSGKKRLLSGVDKSEETDPRSEVRCTLETLLLGERLKKRPNIPNKGKQKRRGQPT